MQQLTSHLFTVVQKLGKAMMLPVAVLPAAGILLGVGAAEFAILPISLSQVMAAAGGAIFANLPLIFAIGVALGFCNNDGVAALAAAIGYVVMLATMGIVTQLQGYAVADIMGIKSINTGVFGGILAGGIASWMFNRYFHITLPAYLGFFSGKRFVPIATSFAAILLGTILSFIWPPIGEVIDSFSNWAATESPALAFTIYGVGERLLVPFGLHHIWNVPFFFEVGQYLDPASGEVIRGEVHRYIAGDPSAGNMAGGYLFKIWGLPAAGLAIWHCARPENRAKVGGIMISAALTSALTGITEPLEFAFLFLAPLLYLLHALLAGAAYLLCIELGIKHGMTFSHGLIDYIVLFNNSSRGLWLLLIGPLWALLYYLLFRFTILRFNLLTPGREMDAGSSAGSAASSDFSQQLIKAFGGADNIASLDACITRLRVEVRSIEAASEAQLKSLGATDVVVVGNNLQAIFGTRSENIKTDLEAYLQATTGQAAAPGDQPALVSTQPSPQSADLQATPAAQTPTMATPATADSAGAESASGSARPATADIQRRAQAMLQALGGNGNIHQLTACAQTRVRIELVNAAQVDQTALARTEGVAGVMSLADNVLHLVLGQDAEHYAAAMHSQL